MREEIEKLMREGLKKLSCEVSEEQVQQLKDFYRIFIEWNQQMNLSAITEESDFVIKHILDAAAGLVYFPQGKKIVDLGSGGGVPGLVLKILAPHLDITLVDAVQKKTKFLIDTANKLGLKLRVFNVSQEKVEREYEVLTCRAFASLEKIVKLSRKYLLPHSLILAYKGTLKSIEEELKPYLKKNLELIQLQVPFLDAERYLVHIQL